MRAHVHACVCVCIRSYMSGRKNSHIEMCAAIARSCLWVYATHTHGGTRGERGPKEAGELRVTSEIKSNEEEQISMSMCVTLPICYRLRFTQAVPKRSISSRMAARLYSVPPTRAGSSVFTAIDFLSSSIWKNMAHMPGGDTATKLDYLSS